MDDALLAQLETPLKRLIMLRTNRTQLIQLAAKYGINSEQRGSFARDVKEKFERIHTDCFDMCERLLDPTPDLNNHLDRFFGQHDEQVINMVRQVLSEMANILASHGSVTITHAARHNPHEYAHVWVDGRQIQPPVIIIYTNNMFIHEIEHELNNRYLTLVHELSHICSGTEDFKYDQEVLWDENALEQGHNGMCIPPLQDQRYTPEEAIANADSYGWFMARMYQPANV
ncbi:M35 family metallo-endopeptidase [Leptothoe sp. ISB3NOV94-8A]|nr:M35 family metallo-endopeptidase [Leptothoe sp. LEGE 181152]